MAATMKLIVNAVHYSSFQCTGIHLMFSLRPRLSALATESVIKLKSVELIKQIFSMGVFYVNIAIIFD